MSTPKTWFITGASSGFGMAFAEFALARGDNVVATARNVGKLEALVAQAPARVLAQKLDVTKVADIGPAIDAAVRRFGRIDYLFNNSGYGIVGAVEETSDAELRAVMDTNFFGAIAVTRAVLPVMRAQRSGAIVNISSMGGQMSFEGVGAYSASKFALEGMSEALALEAAPFGIKVLIVEPGAFRTEFGAGALRFMPVSAAYKDVLGNVRDLMHGMDGAQPGDPAKAARAVVAALEADVTPLRLQLGADAIGAVRAHAERLLKDLAQWERVGTETAVVVGGGGAGHQFP
ncbi:MAG TPA: oxidoreductase [Steroidobacteraceae bacterium]|nr:oxidoreductase [Steroidobacteraceae bacterium]